MRFGQICYRRGDQRVRRAFLWFPRYFDGQWRWLEVAALNEWLGASGIWWAEHWAEPNDGWIDGKGS